MMITDQNLESSANNVSLIPNFELSLRDLEQMSNYDDLILSAGTNQYMDKMKKVYAERPT